MSEDPAKDRKDYDARLQRRLKILQQKLAEGKVRFQKGQSVIAALEKVRFAPDGTVDLATVDGSVRALALAVEGFHDREEEKKSVSLATIQTTYFEFLERNFGHFYKEMKGRGLNPHDAARAISSSKGNISELIKDLPEFLETIREFWLTEGSVAHAHVEDMHGTLKGVFGGDLFPSADENIASKCGLYTDTLVLPDPFLRSKHVFELASDEKKAYYLVKHGLNLLQYKTLACADVSPPIVVVLPDMATLEEDEAQFFFGLGQSDGAIHAGKLFGRKFSSFDEVMEFCATLDTVEWVAAEIAEPQRLLFDTEWGGSAADQLSRASGDPSYSEILGKLGAGELVASHIVGRMSICNEILVRARRLRGTPIVDAPTSWQYLAWKLEYDAAPGEAAGGGVGELHVVRGLQSLADSEMRWLGRVPPEALIEVRKSGALAEMRGILNKGVEELAVSNPRNFYRTSDLVFDNITAAFDEHQKNIDELTTKKWKFAGSDVGSWLVVGTLAVTSASTGLPVLGLAAVVADQLLDPPKLKNIPKSIRALAAETKSLKRSPVGMLFSLSKRKT